MAIALANKLIILNYNKKTTMQIEGKIKVIKETQHVSDKFRKREFVLTTEESTPYPQHLQIELTQDKTELINNYQVGDKVKVSINLRGREYTGNDGVVKYFNTIQAWRIESGQSAGATSNPVVSNDNDDLPF